MNLVDRIDKLAKKFTSGAYFNEQQIFSTWKKDVVSSLIILNLKEHQAVQRLLEQLHGEVNEMNELLLTADSKILSNDQRDRVLDRKALYTWFISFFDGAEKTLEIVEKEVTANEKANANK